MTQAEFDEKLDAAALAAGPGIKGWNWRYRQGLKDQGLVIIHSGSAMNGPIWTTPPIPFEGDQGEDGWDVNVARIVPA